MKIFFLRNALTIFLILLLSSSIPAQIVQDDPLLIPRTSTLPIIDGVGDDACWQNSEWQSIGKVWIPFNGSVPESDYTGRYKVMWSSETNLLYFLIEVTDDEFVDGYTPSVYGGSYNWDITEVFIDENNSGGEHRYDTQTTNAENAFAYHMYAEYAPDGEESSYLYFEDMQGTQANSQWVDYTSHFPEFVLIKNGNTAIREFSLIVYNDTYSPDNEEDAIADLKVGKVMGLTLAYCDNDDQDENPKARDNMYGSVIEPAPGNLHWMNADHFGEAKLVDDPTTGVNNSEDIPNNFLLNQNYPNPFNPTTSITYQIANTESVTLKVYDILSNEVQTLVNKTQNAGEYNVGFDASKLSSGMYIYKLQAGSFISVKKMLLLK